jgi:hypothetical protein
VKKHHARCLALLACALLLVLAAHHAAHAAEIDLASHYLDGSATALPGGAVSYAVVYANLSDTAPVDAYLNVDLPVGAFIDDPGFFLFANDSLGNTPGLSFSSSCENLLLHVQGPGGTVPEPLDLPAQSAGLLTFSFTMPTSTVTTRAVRVQEPGSEPRDLEHNVGVCDDCFDPATCFGPRITSVVPPIEAEYAIVDDGSANPTLGCDPIINDLTGKIALVRRGDCDFGLKALNAQDAGAVACVVMNNDPDQDVTTFGILGGTFGPQVTVPVAIIGNADADPMEAAIVGGATLTGLVGGVDTADLVYRSRIFHSNGMDTDPDPSNDLDSFATLFQYAVFSDGFESGDTTAWSGKDVSSPPVTRPGITVPDPVVVVHRRDGGVRPPDMSPALLPRRR